METSEPFHYTTRTAYAITSASLMILYACTAKTPRQMLKGAIRILQISLYLSSFIRAFGIVVRMYTVHWFIPVEYLSYCIYYYFAQLLNVFPALNLPKIPQFILLLFIHACTALYPWQVVYDYYPDLTRGMEDSYIYLFIYFFTSLVSILSGLVISHDVAVITLQIFRKIE